jgi:hypothetical protein
MSICGFTPRMADGIKIFCDGLLEAASVRAEKRGENLADAFQNEIKEIDVLIGELRLAQNRRSVPRYTSMLGIVMLARGLFEASLFTSRADQVSLDVAFDKEGQVIGTLLEELENYYEKTVGEKGSERAIQEMVGLIS